MSGLTGFQDGYNTSTHLGTVYAAVTEEVKHPQKLPPIKDTTSVSEAHGESIRLLYKALEAIPELPLPTALPANIDLVSHMIQNFPEQLLNAMNELPIVEDHFPSEMEEEINHLSDEKLTIIGGGNKAKGKERVRFAVLHPGANFSSELKELAASIREKASVSSGSFPNETLVAVEDHAIFVIAEGSFQLAVQEMKLTAKEEKLLYFAHQVPNAKASLPPHLQAALKKAEASALSQTQDKFGFPDDWLPAPDSKSYEGMIGEHLDQKVAKTLSDQLNNKQISKAQYNEMRTLLYTSEETPNAAILRPILEKLLQESTKSLQNDFGFPDDYSPSLDGANYKAMLNGAFLSEFNRQLGNPSLNLDSEQKTLLKKALISPEAANKLPNSLKAIFQTIEAAATAKIVKTYGVSEAWAADIQALSMAAATEVSNPNIASAQGAFNQVKEWVSLSNKAVGNIEQKASDNGKALPPFVQLIKDYLKIVSLALMEMQEMLFTLSITDANLATLLNKIQNDDKIGQLEKQEKELKEVMEKQKKMASLGPLKALFQWLINIILVMLLGPIGIALMVNSLAQTVKKGMESGNMGKAFMNANVLTDLGKMLEDVGKSIGGPFGKLFGNLATLMTTVTIIFFAPAAFLIDLMLGSATFIKQLCKGIGLDKKTSEKITMAIQMTAQVVAGIALMVVTGGTSIELMAANFAKSIGETALSVLKTVQSVLQPFIDAFINVLSKIFPAVEGSGQGVMNGARVAIENFIKSADEAIKGLTDGLKEVQKLEGLLREAKQVEEAAKASLRTADEIANAEANILKLGEQLTKATDVVKEAAAFSKRAVSGAKTVATTLPEIVQGAVSINNNIVQAQIARIKGGMEAAMILIEQFVKLMKDLVAKLMDMVKSTGQDIKQVGEQHQQMFAQASQTISNMFSGA